MRRTGRSSRAAHTVAFNRLVRDLPHQKMKLLSARRIAPKLLLPRAACGFDTQPGNLNLHPRNRQAQSGNRLRHSSNRHLHPCNRRRQPGNWRQLLRNRHTRLGNRRRRSSNASKHLCNRQLQPSHRNALPGNRRKHTITNDLRLSPSPASEFRRFVRTSHLATRRSRGPHRSPGGIQAIRAGLLRMAIKGTRALRPFRYVILSAGRSARRAPVPQWLRGLDGNRA